MCSSDLHEADRLSIRFSITGYGVHDVSGARSMARFTTDIDEMRSQVRGPEPFFEFIPHRVASHAFRVIIVFFMDQRSERFGVPSPFPLAVFGLVAFDALVRPDKPDGGTPLDLQLEQSFFFELALVSVQERNDLLVGFEFRVQ